MNQTYATSPKEVSLEFGLLFLKTFFETDYLHYGYFEEGVIPSATSFAAAQAKYTEQLVGTIPEGVKSILDVGCGSGSIGCLLLDRGYQVDAVSPGRVLTEHAKRKFADRGTIFNERFEDLEYQGKQYDLLMSSESFQYVPLAGLFDRCKKFLKPGGHLLICDFFRIPADGPCGVGGGHSYAEFERELADSGFRTVVNRDITRYTAPTIDLVHQLSKGFLKPLSTVLTQLVSVKHPLIYKLVRFKFGKKIKKLSDRQFSDVRTAENFARHKTYRTLLLQS